MQKGTYDTLADEASSSMFDESKWTPSRLKIFGDLLSCSSDPCPLTCFFFCLRGSAQASMIEKLGGRALPAKFGAARLVLSPHKPPKNTRLCVARKVRSGTARVLNPPKYI